MERTWSSREDEEVKGEVNAHLNHKMKERKSTWKNVTFAQTSLGVGVDLFKK